MRRERFSARLGRASLVFVLALGWLAPAASAADECGLERAEVVADDGIGGTGRGARAGKKPGDGIGGTGRHAIEGDGIGGTGVFGTVTSFAPLCVNGRRIVYDASTPLQVGGRAGSTQELRVGHVVWIVGGAEQGAVHAGRIERFVAAHGAIEGVQPSRRSIRVGGRWVTLLDQALVVDHESGLHLDPRGLRVGERVAVSGLADATGRIFASRVDRVAAGRSDAPGAAGSIVLPDVAKLAREAGVADLSVDGFVTADADGRLFVGSLALEASALDARGRGALSSDTRVWVDGAAQASGLRARRVWLPPTPVRPPAPAPKPNLPGLPRPDLQRPEVPRTSPVTKRPVDRRGAPAPRPRIGPGDGPSRIEPDVAPAPAPVRRDAPRSVR